MTTSNEILKLCASGASTPVLKTTAAISDDGKNSNTTITAAQELAHLQTQARVTTNLQTTTDPAVFTPVESTDIDTLANSYLQNSAGQSAANNYGDVQSVVATPAVNSSLNAVYTALNETTEGVARSLNTAMAMAVTPVQAATVKPSAQVAKVAAYPVNEILNDKYSPDFDRPVQTLPLSKTNLAVNAPATTPAFSPSPAEIATADAGSALTKATTPPASATNTVSNNRSPASVAPQPASLSTVAKAETSAPNRKPASVDAITTEPLQATFGTSPQKLDTPALQTLTAFNQMSGPKYQMIRQQYQDPTFEEQLKARGISIVVVNKAGQTVRKIGAVTGAEVYFVDNGKALIKVESKK